MRIGLVMAGVFSVVLTAGASAMVMDSSGNVTDWGIRPFSLSNRSDSQVGNLWSTIQNDYSPINYPSGVGHVPCPGGTTGEKFDLEEMHVRTTNALTQVLVVTSSQLTTQASGSTWYLGDLFITVAGQQFAVVTQHATTGLTAGSVYRINGAADVLKLQAASGSFLGNTTLVQNDYGPNAKVEDVAGPWAVKSTISPSQLLGTATLGTATYNYGGAENGTFLIEYSIGNSLLGITNPTESFMTKMTWGCGNDVIRTQGLTAGVPEPATFGLMVFGAIATYMASRRRRTMRQ